MAEKSTEQQVIGTLMHNPTILLQSDKYQLSREDFSDPLYRYFFWAIENLGPKATGALKPYEIEEWLKTSNRANAVIAVKDGRQLLNDCEGVPVGSFDALYDKLKKENLIRDLQNNGYDTSSIYVRNPITQEDSAINERYTEASTQDIIKEVETKILQIKSKYTLQDASEVQTLSCGIAEMLEELEECPEFGLPIQGGLFNYIVSGAIPGRFYLRSGSSGLGKTRSLVADACFLAYPLRYDWSEHRWIRIGESQKVMVIITEQNFDEIKKMVLAYLTGINESTIKKNLCTPEQKIVLKQALKVLKEYEDNFYIVRVPNPTITLIKQLVREQVALHDIRYVFYDYIFISPSLLSEFRGVALRNDEILLMFSDALKQLAVELDIFMMSSTQVNAKADASGDIRNEASIAGSRAVINKADVGCIIARPTKDELATLSEVIATFDNEPNVVTDIYKLRGGENTQTRIWSYMDLGTLRRKDLFITNARLEQIDIGYEVPEIEPDEEEECRAMSMIEKLNREGYAS